MRQFSGVLFATLILLTILSFSNSQTNQKLLPQLQGTKSTINLPLAVQHVLDYDAYSLAGKSPGGSR